MEKPIFDQAFDELKAHPSPQRLEGFTTQVEVIGRMLDKDVMKQNLLRCLTQILNEEKFDTIRLDENMLRLYKLMGEHSERLGGPGVYEQLHRKAYFNKSLKFYLQWAEACAKKNMPKEFKHVLKLARDALSGTMPIAVIELGFRDIADEHFEGVHDIFASPDETMDLFRDEKDKKKVKRRSSVCFIRNIAPKRDSKVAPFGKGTRTKIRKEFIDTPEDHGLSPEELRFASWKDTFGEDVEMQRRDSGIVHVQHRPDDSDRRAREEVENRINANLNPRRRALSTLSEDDADDQEEEKRTRVFSPLVATKDAIRPALRNSASKDNVAPSTITLSSDTDSASAKDVSYTNLDDSDAGENEKLKMMSAGRGIDRPSTTTNTISIASTTSSSTRTAKSGDGLGMLAENNCLEAHALFSETVHLGSDKTMVLGEDTAMDHTKTLAPTQMLTDFSVLCDPDPTMTMTEHDRPKKTSGGLNMVFDEQAVEEEDGPVIVLEQKKITQIKEEEKEDVRSRKSHLTPPSFGFEQEDMFDEDVVRGFGFDKLPTRGGTVTSTPAAHIPFVDIDSYFGNKKDEEEREPAKPSFAIPSGSTLQKLMRRKSQAASAIQAQTSAPPAPPAPVPKELPKAANSSIDCLSDNLGRRLSLGADEIKKEMAVADELETTGCVNRRRSEIIHKGDINPWDENLRRKLMMTVRIPLNMHEFAERAPKMQAHRDFEVGGEVLSIQTLIGQGGYAKVYRAVNEEKKTVAVKYEVPSCAWEVYICDQMRNRLIKDGSDDHAKMADWCIMQVMDAYVFSTASLLVNEYHEHGTLLEMVNNMKDPNWHISCFLLVQIARIMKEVHACKIIHGDIKPDNFMITRKIDANWGKDALLSSDTYVIKLIDWGRAIDMMQLNDQSFKGRAGTEGFDCPEMIDGRPWNYHTDFFGFAVTMVVLMSGKYPKMTGDIGAYDLDYEIKRRNNIRDVVAKTIEKYLNIPSSHALPDWSEIVADLSAVWDNQFDVSTWKQSVTRFNGACDIAANTHK